MPIPQRPRTPRYLVAKWDDIHHALDAREVHSLISMLTKISQNRRTRNLSDTRQYVVVSDKNREMYDEVWGMVLAEIEEAHEAQREASRQAIRDLHQRFAALQQSQFTFTTDEAEQDTVAPDEEYALETPVDPAPSGFPSRMGRNEPSLADVETSFTNAWGQAVAATTGRVVSNSGSVRYSRWQPAVAVSNDNREVPDYSYDLETYQQ